MAAAEEGIVVFGPGSEWFWVMAQFVALSLTGLAIYRQLRAQAWANQFAVVTRLADWFDSEETTRHKLAALVALGEGSAILTPSLSRCATHIDNIALGITNGHLSARIAYEEWGDLAQMWWRYVAPVLANARSHEPSLWRAWEAWLPEIQRRDRKAGKTLDLSPERVAWEMADAIAYYRDGIAVAESMRNP